MTQTELNNVLTALWSKVTELFARKSELAGQCPIIEDKRSSAVAAITGVAPFASLADGQRIVLHLNKNMVSKSSLNLTLSDGRTTGAIVMWSSHKETAKSTVFSTIYGGSYIDMVYNAADNKWVMIGQRDTNNTYSAMAQSQIDAGTGTGGYTISAKLLRDNFYLKSEVDNLIPDVSGKADKRVAVYASVTADWVYQDYGVAAPQSTIEGLLDQYLPDWRNDAAVMSVYSALLDGKDVTGVTMSSNAYNAVVTVSVDLDAAGYNTMNSENEVVANPTLNNNAYVVYGTTDAVAPTLPSVVDAADEFVFSFTCASDACVLTLPSGVRMADGFDFEADRKAGVKFQVSIMDGIAGYLYLTP